MLLLWNKDTGWPRSCQSIYIICNWCKTCSRTSCSNVEQDLSETAGFVTKHTQRSPSAHSKPAEAVFDARCARAATTAAGFSSIDCNKPLAFPTGFLPSILLASSSCTDAWQQDGWQKTGSSPNSSQQQYNVIAASSLSDQVSCPGLTCSQHVQIGQDGI